MRGRPGAAFRAGFITLLLGLLCAATLAAPKLAAEQGFSHTHPHGTEGHLHPFKLVVGNGVVPIPVGVVSPVQRVSRVRLPASPWVSVGTETQHHSRAPPG